MFGNKHILYDPLHSAVVASTIVSGGWGEIGWHMAVPAGRESAREEEVIEEEEE